MFLAKASPQISLTADWTAYSALKYWSSLVRKLASTLDVSLYEGWDVSLRHFLYVICTQLLILKMQEKTKTLVNILILLITNYNI